MSVKENILKSLSEFTLLRGGLDDYIECLAEHCLPVLYQKALSRLRRSSEDKEINAVEAVSNNHVDQKADQCPFYLNKIQTLR